MIFGLDSVTDCGSSLHMHLNGVVMQILLISLQLLLFNMLIIFWLWLASHSRSAIDLSVAPQIRLMDWIILIRECLTVTYREHPSGNVSVRGKPCSPSCLSARALVSGSQCHLLLKTKISTTRYKSVCMCVFLYRSVLHLPQGLML